MVTPKGNIIMRLRPARLFFFTLIFLLTSRSKPSTLQSTSSVACPHYSLEVSPPFELLYGSSLNYENFHHFGCCVYSSLCDYKSNKFSLRGIPCIFMGPSVDCTSLNMHSLINITFFFRNLSCSTHLIFPIFHFFKTRLILYWNIFSWALFSFHHSIKI